MKNFDEWWAEHRGFILARIEDWSPKQMMRTAYDAGRCSYRCPHYMDAERYRWLRDMIKNQDLTIAKVGSWSLESWSGDDPDHYIDTAMEKQE